MDKKSFIEAIVDNVGIIETLLGNIYELKEDSKRNISENCQFIASLDGILGNLTILKIFLRDVCPTYLE